MSASDLRVKPTSLVSRLVAPGAWRVVGLGVALVVVSVCGFQSLRGIGQPFPGFFVWENLFVPAIGAPSWTGVRSGLSYQSWVLRADGVDVNTAKELNEVLRGKRIGEVVRYDAQQGDRQFTVNVPIERFTLRHYVESIGVFLFDAVALMTLAVAMLYLKPIGGDSSALALFATNLALFLATAIDLFGPYNFRPAYFFFAGAAPTTALTVLSWFPVGRVRRRWETPALVLLAAVSLAFGIASYATFFSDRHALLLLDRLFHVYLTSSVLVSVVFFAWHFATSPETNVRQRTKVVLLTSLAAFLPVLAVVALYLGTATIPFNVLTVFFVIFPAGIGYAIAKHDLFDVDRLIKRALAYVLLSAAVLGGYGLVITLFGVAFEGVTGAVERMTSGLVVLALLLLLNPSRDRMQAFVDRVYDRRGYEYRDVVRRTSRRFGAILDFEALIRTSLELIDETVQPLSAEVFTLGSDGVPVRRAMLLYADGPGSEGTLVVRDLVCPELIATAEALRVSGVFTGAMPAGREGEVEVLRVLATGMQLEGRETGFLVVGPKRAGGSPIGDDAELLRTMSDQLAVALENAQAYRTIASLNAELHVKADALLRANRELHEAQDQLVRTERLAAIGELSGAVAHAMRNPLAAIKMAADFGGMEFEQHAAGENFRDISSEAGRLEQRIRDLLDFARPFEPHPECVDFYALASRAVDVSRGRARERSVDLTMQAALDPILATVDPALFEQVMIELIANAIDASPAGKCVEVATGLGDESEGGVWLSVSDQGAGIPADKRAHIFDLFFTTKKTGTGFGLATVRKIVDRHAGKISVETAVAGVDAGLGTRFRIWLPPA